MTHLLQFFNCICKEKLPKDTIPLVNLLYAGVLADCVMYDLTQHLVCKVFLPFPCDNNNLIFCSYFMGNNSTCK